MSEDTPDREQAEVDEPETLAEIPRRGRLALASAVVVALVAGSLVWVLASGGDSTDRAAHSALLGQEVPPVAGESLLDGTSFDIAEHEGSWVVVNYFATWCPPCVREHPELVALDEAYQGSDEVALISVVFDEDPDDVTAFFRRQGGEWPVIYDPEGRIAVDFGVTGVPETYIVDPFGVVRRKLIGGVTRAGLEAQIADARAELEAELTGEEAAGDARAAEGGGAS